MRGFGEPARARTALAALALMALGAGPAAAYQTGITGWSGQRGPVCNKCHGGGIAPTVRIEGPAIVQPGALATFRLVVVSQSQTQIAAGFNLTTDGGRLDAVPDQGAQRFDGELTHLAPKRNAPDGSAAWDLDWTAPQIPGTYALYVAANSVDLNGTSSGDRAATLQIAIQVPGPEGTSTPTPTPTATPTAIPTRTTTPTPPRLCPGDCNRDGTTAVDELLRGVHLALTDTAAADCSALDSDRNGRVSLVELVSAVDAALHACAGR